MRRNFPQLLLISALLVLTMAGMPASLLAQSIIYSGEQRTAAIAGPRRVQQSQESGLTYELSLSTEINPSLSPAEFAVPDGYTQVTRPTQPELIEAGEGVYYVDGVSDSPHGTPVVEFKDFLVVFDAPFEDMSQRVIEALRARFPSKPIRYLIISHAHLDHGSGIIPYIRQGATILTDASEVVRLRRYARVHSHLFDLEPDQPVPEPRIQTITGRFVISDGRRRLAVEQFGATTHSANNLIAYAEPAKAIIHGDLRSVGVLPNATFAAFDKWLDRKTNIEWIVGVHHRPMRR